MTTGAYLHLNRLPAWPYRDSYRHSHRHRLAAGVPAAVAGRAVPALALAHSPRYEADSPLAERGHQVGSWREKGVQAVEFSSSKTEHLSLIRTAPAPPRRPPSLHSGSSPGPADNAAGRPTAPSKTYCGDRPRYRLGARLKGRAARQVPRSVLLVRVSPGVLSRAATHRRRDGTCHHRLFPSVGPAMGGQGIGWGARSSCAGPIPVVLKPRLGGIMDRAINLVSRR